MIERRLWSPGVGGLMAAAGWLVPALAGMGEEWPNWRGPHFNGASEERDLPAAFSKTNAVKWCAPLPGPSAATPVVWGERVFVSAAEPATKTLWALGLDRRTGRELWRRPCGQGFARDDRSNFASPSPVTDGKRVWFYYGTGDLAAFDLDGAPLWSRNLQNDYGQFAFLWTYGSSPLLFDGRLYVQVLQRDVPVQGRGRADAPNESYLLALDPASGRELWRRVRPSDARQESREAYSTPLPVTLDGRTELVVVGGDCVTGHSAETGEELWRWGTWNPQRITHWRLVPSAVAGDGVVLACAPKGGAVYAFKAGARGVLDDAALAWVSRDRNVSSDVCTPLFYRGRFYVLNGERRVLSRIVPASGQVEWTGELGRGPKIEASPTAADGRIYFMDHAGTVYVVAADEQFRLLDTVNMADPGDDRLRSSIAVSGGNLFIRTGSKLYCVGR